MYFGHRLQEPDAAAAQRFAIAAQGAALQSSS
jgi:hypothetical protein